MHARSGHVIYNMVVCVRARACVYVCVCVGGWVVSWSITRFWLVSGDSRLSYSLSTCIIAVK